MKIKTQNKDAIAKESLNSLINIITSNIEMQNITSGIRLPENKIPEKKIIGITVEIKNFCLSSFFQITGMRMTKQVLKRFIPINFQNKILKLKKMKMF